ncbi:tellurite resistance/C4-dicarboxylate transporter family protein [Pigmentiphaga sp. CHJ604]|uniref:tellurite resistance/C4-dicarboxylate transporter family protein n=1 Tax=Pigmentiphaga sp. CHJ604 TaxID=3081984 RepID=UPI0030D499A3
MILRFEHGARDSLRTMHPGYFAMVMATSALSVAAYCHDVPILPAALLVLNTVVVLVLAAAYVCRACVYSEDFRLDIFNHSRGMGFFTLVAGLATYGTQICLQTDARWLGVGLLGLSAVLWLVINYGVLAALTTRADKPTLEHGLNGAWLLVVVAMQSLVVLATMLMAHGAFPQARHELAFLALAMWLAGGVLYVWIMALIVLRYAFTRMEPEAFTSPYWINMGAVAISTLAGAELVKHASLSALLAEMLPFLKGGVVLFWAIASWWIPLLLVLGFWRHVMKDIALSYDTLHWGGVFPLAMYSICTFHVARIFQLPFASAVSQLFMGLATVAWATVFIGLVDSFVLRD